MVVFDRLQRSGAYVVLASGATFVSLPSASGRQATEPPMPPSLAHEACSECPPIVAFPFQEGGSNWPLPCVGAWIGGCIEDSNTNPGNWPDNPAAGQAAGGAGGSGSCTSVRCYTACDREAPWTIEICFSILSIQICFYVPAMTPEPICNSDSSNECREGLEPRSNSSGADDVVCPDDPCASCLLYTSPSPRDRTRSRMPSSA